MHDKNSSECSQQKSKFRMIENSFSAQQQVVSNTCCSTIKESQHGNEHTSWSGFPEMNLWSSTLSTVIPTQIMECSQSAEKHSMMSGF